MGKKNRRNKKKTEIVKYTEEERKEQVEQLKAKIVMLGFGTYEKEMNQLYQIMDEFIKDGTEYNGKIILPGSERTMVIKFLNNKKHQVSIVLKYNKGI